MNDANNFIEWSYRGAAGLLVAFISWWTSRMHNRLDEYERIRNTGFQRLAAIEAHYEDIEARLERIERKLDNLNGKH